MHIITDNFGSEVGAPPLRRCVVDDYGTASEPPSAAMEQPPVQPFCGLDVRHWFSFNQDGDWLPHPAVSSIQGAHSHE